MHGGGGGIVPGAGYIYLVWNDQCMGYCFCTYPNLHTYTIVKICTSMPVYSGTNSTSISMFYQNFTSTRLYKATFSCLQCTHKVRTSILFLHLATSIGCFWTRTIFLNKKRTGQVTMNLLYIRFTYYIKIIIRNVSGLATNSPCGAWGRRWTTWILYDGPPFGFGFYVNWCVSLVERFLYWCLAFIHVLYITKVLPITFRLKWFTLN